jgi:hypothetical protein
MIGSSFLLIIATAIAPHFPSSYSPLQVTSPGWKWHSARYKKSRDYRSLRVLTKRLKVGMPRAKVEEVLGEPDYSPVEGQYYYSSDRENSKGVILGLVVEYRRTEYRGGDIHTAITGRLESFRLMAIGE